MKPEPQLVEAWHALTAGLRPAIVQGHVIDVLRDFPAEAFQAVVTSPPYWGLRLYGTEPQVWGGRAGHDHAWSQTPPRRPRSVNDVKDPESKLVTSMGQDYDAQGGETCECGAWKGELGLEPTPELYVDHIGDVFDAVRRVLRSDGVLWLNLGDTYTTHPAGVTDHRRTQRSTLTKGRDLTGTLQSGVMDKRQFKHNRREEPGGPPMPTQHSGPHGVPNLREKNLVGIPWRVAFELQRRGWWLRSDCVWAKPNPMPESVVDRPTRAHEYVFLLTKSARYFYDADAVRSDYAASSLNRLQYAFDGSKNGDTAWRVESHGVAARFEKNGGSNLKTAWWIPTEPVTEAHFATFPQKLVETCLLAGTSAKGACAECGVPWRREVKAEGGTIGTDVSNWHPVKGLEMGRRSGHDGARGMSGKAGDGTYKRTTLGFVPGCECGSAETIACAVLDPFGGSGTVPLVARRLGLRSVAVELKPDYVELARKRAGQIADITEAV